MEATIATRTEAAASTRASPARRSVFRAATRFADAHATEELARERAGTGRLESA
jgi:hypothetical protein